MNNKWSKNFDKRPHRRLVTRCGGKQIRPYRPNDGFLGLLQSAPQRHLDQFSRVLCTLQHTLPMLFSGADIPQNCPFLWRIGAPSNTWFLGPTQVSP